MMNIVRPIQYIQAHQLAARGSSDCAKILQRAELHIRASKEFKRTGIPKHLAIHQIIAI
jgi:hypothetical protein